MTSLPGVNCTSSQLCSSFRLEVNLLPSLLDTKDFIESQSRRDSSTVCYAESGVVRFTDLYNFMAF